MKDHLHFLVVRQAAVFVAVATFAAVAWRGAAAGADVNAYRTGRLDPRLAGVPAEIQQGVFVDPRRYCEPLVHALTDGVADDFHKVKILHDWLAENIAYDTESYFAGLHSAAAWESTLLGRKSVCQGYAALMERMCRAAGVACEVISGYGRGYGFTLARKENPQQGNHAWNSVYVQGRWHLLDVTWDAGHVKQRAFEKRYSTAYLFAEPRQFIHTHFPTNPQWQLLEPVCTAEEFTRLPVLPGEFFEQGLRLATSLQRLHAVGATVQITIESPADVLLMAQLQDAAAATGFLERRTLVRRQGGRSDILMAFPQAGPWNLVVFSKRRDAPGSYWQVAKLEFVSNAGTTWIFPATFSSIGRMDSFLEGPLFVPLATTAPHEFKIRVHGVEEVSLRLGTSRWLPMRPTAGDVELYQLTVQPAAGEHVKIVGRPLGGDRRYWTLVDFTPEGKSAQ